MIVVIIAGRSGARLHGILSPDCHKASSCFDWQKPWSTMFMSRASSLTTKFVVTEASHALRKNNYQRNLMRKILLLNLPGAERRSCYMRGSLFSSFWVSTRIRPIAFKPADHYIRDYNWLHALLRIASRISEQSNKIVLIGVEPDILKSLPGFGTFKGGSMIAREAGLPASMLKTSKENQIIKLLQQYLNTGAYLWNCMVTLWVHYKHSSVEMNQYAPRTSRQTI